MCSKTVIVDVWLMPVFKTNIILCSNIFELRAAIKEIGNFVRWMNYKLST